jgi:hypothetical protein
MPQDATIPREAFIAKIDQQKAPVNAGRVVFCLSIRINAGCAASASWRAFSVCSRSRVS